MGTDNETILAAVAAALQAANAWRGSDHYEPADLVLSVRFDGELAAPTVAGWQATLGHLHVSGAAMPLVALEMLRETFTNRDARERGAGSRR
jgi:hypothetical protein